MSSVVFLHAVNAGGANQCQPALIAKELAKFGVVNLGAVGTFVFRQNVSEATLRAAIAKKLRFKMRDNDLSHTRHPQTCIQGSVGTTTVRRKHHDPFDHTSIWMAHLFADSNGSWSVAVGKVFGKQHPDLIVSKVSLSQATLKAGDQLTINYKVANVGDGLAENVRVKASLVTVTLKDRIVLGEDTPAVIGSGKSKARIFTVTLPRKLAAGNYHVVVVGEVRSEQTEYNTADNNAQSPLQVTSP